MPRSMKWGVSAVIILVLLLVLAPFTIVGAGEMAVVTRVGQVSRTLDPGIHWVTPIVEGVHTFDVRTQKEDVEASAASRDLQDVAAQVAVNYNVNPTSVAALYATIGSDYARVIITPSLQEGIKAATAKYTAEELITKRAVVTDEILKNVKTGVDARAKGDYIMVTSIAITDFKFSESFNTSIEAKVKAEQDALKAKNDLARIDFEAQQKERTAVADAKVITLQSEAANNEKYVSLKRIEVQLEQAKRWNGVLPVNMYGSAPLPLLDLTVRQ